MSIELEEKNVLLTDSINKLNSFIDNQEYSIVVFVPENGKLNYGDSAYVYVDIKYEGPFLNKNAKACIANSEDSLYKVFDNAIKYNNTSELDIIPIEDSNDEVRFVLKNLKRGSNYFGGIIEVQNELNRRKILPFGNEIIVK
jgi:hypothetical protein